MKKLINNILSFFTVTIWRVKRQDVSPLKYFCYEIIKKLFLAIESATTKRMTDSASALTYSTLLAIVPILAVVFAIARGLVIINILSLGLETFYRASHKQQKLLSDL